VSDYGNSAPPDQLTAGAAVLVLQVRQLQGAGGAGMEAASWLAGRQAWCHGGMVPPGMVTRRRRLDRLSRITALRV